MLAQFFPKPGRRDFNDCSKFLRSAFRILYGSRIGGQGFYFNADGQFLIVAVVNLSAPRLEMKISADLFVRNTRPPLPLEKLNLKAPSNQQQKA